MIDRKKLMKSYNRRNGKLRQLGFASYPEYLKSELWASIRSRVLERDNGKCCGCGGEARVAHHSCYTNAALTGRSIQGLWSLCHKCHRFIEFDKSGEKVRLSETRKRFHLLLHLNNRSMDDALKTRPQKRRKSRRNAACSKCGSTAIKVKLQKFKNGTKHRRANCGGCGSFLRYMKKHGEQAQK